MQNGDLKMEIAAAILTGVCVTLLISSGMPLWDWVAARQIADIRSRMDELNLNPSALDKWMRVWGIAMAGVLIGGTILGYLPIAVCIVVIIFTLPRWWLAGMVRRRTTMLRDQMVGACIAMSNASRAGLGLASSLQTISTEVKPPLADELKKIVSDYQFGKPLDEAIVEATDRIQTDSFALFSNAIQVSLEQGGKITEALERISVSLQENQRLDRKIEADTQSARMVINVLCVIPFVFLAGFSFLEPTGMGLLFNTLPGQFIIAGVMITVYLVRRWSETIINIDV